MEHQFSDLPAEILWHIYRYLNHGDLQAAAATCTRWREAIHTPEFHENTVVRFSKLHLSDSSPPATIFLKSQRPFRNLILRKIDLSSVSETMAHMGQWIEHITFEKIQLDYKSFSKILKGLPRLRSLIIKNCRLLESDDISFECLLVDACTSIKHLSLTYYSSEILSPLTSSKSGLVSLDLPVSNIFLPSILKRVLLHHRPTLRKLNLSESKINRSMLSEIKALDLKLTHLGLAKCYWLDATSLNGFLVTQPGLVQIDLNSNDWINDEVLQTIVLHNPLLQEVNISWCKNITNVGARSLGRLKHLRCLNISYCGGITSEGLTEGIAKGPNPKMRELRIKDLTVDGECIRSVAVNMSELRVLDVSDCCDGMTDETMQCIIENCRWLRELYLVGCNLISDAAFTGSPQRHSIDELQGLRVLSLWKLDNITDIALNNIFKLKELRSLNLSQCHRVQFKNIEIIWTSSSLENIDLSYCKNLTNQVIDLWTSNFPRLRALRLSNCSQLDLRVISDCKFPAVVINYRKFPVRRAGVTLMERI